MTNTAFSFDNGLNTNSVAPTQGWTPKTIKRYTVNITGKPVEGDPTQKAMAMARRNNLG